MPSTLCKNILFTTASQALSTASQHLHYRYFWREEAIKQTSKPTYFYLAIQLWAMLPCTYRSWENERLFATVSNTQAMMKGSSEQKVHPDTPRQGDHHNAISGSLLWSYCVWSLNIFNSKIVHTYTQAKATNSFIKMCIFSSSYCGGEKNLFILLGSFSCSNN